MDTYSTTPLLYRTRIDIINQATQQQQCLLVPNPYGNVTAQVWANPVTKKATLVIDGKPLSESVQAQLLKTLRSPELDHLLGMHRESTDPLGKILEETEHGYQVFKARYELKATHDTVRLRQKTANGTFKEIAKVADNYRANGPAIVQPNSASPHRPGTKGYRALAKPITPTTAQALRKSGLGLEALGGSHFTKVRGTIGAIGYAADTAEMARFIANEQYDQAKKKASGMVGSWTAAKAGVSTGARLGMAIPIPHPIAKAAAVALLGIAGGIGGAFFGESAGEWLYSEAVKKAPEPFETFPTDINNDQFKTYLDSQRLFNPNEEIIGYTKSPDGTASAIRRSDLSRE